MGTNYYCIIGLKPLQSKNIMGVCIIPAECVLHLGKSSRMFMVYVGEPNNKYYNDLESLDSFINRGDVIIYNEYTERISNPDFMDYVKNRCEFTEKEIS